MRTRQAGEVKNVPKMRIDDLEGVRLGSASYVNSVVFCSDGGAIPLAGTNCRRGG